jgi:anti-sigma-K factor RskA
MIDTGTALKLQALLDGELSASEVSSATRLLEQNPEARQLYDQLQLTREMLRRCEPEHVVPETRAFYWSRIERAIGSSMPRPEARRSGVWTGWLRWMIPAGAAAALGLVLLQQNWVGSDPDPVVLATDHQVETLLADTTSISFRSESAGMTVFWVQSDQPNYLGSGY